MFLKIKEQPDLVLHIFTILSLHTHLSVYQIFWTDLSWSCTSQLLEITLCVDWLVDKLCSILARSGGVLSSLVIGDFLSNKWPHYGHRTMGVSRDNHIDCRTSVAQYLKLPR